MLHRGVPFARRTVAAVTTLSACAVLGIGLSQSASARPSNSGPWNDKAGRELEQELLHLHQYWNTMNVPALQRSIVGDDKLVTFDLDPDTYAPIRLASRAELAGFTDRMFQQYKNTHTKTVAEHPSIACRATSNVGICTEECKVELFLADGTKQVQHLLGTAVAVREETGWKWIQWHMSPAGPIETIKPTEGKQ